MIKYLILFVIGLGSSLGFTFWVRLAASRWGIMDLPGARKIHSRPVPRLGGVAIFAAFFSILLLEVYRPNIFSPADLSRAIHLKWFLAASGVVLCLGVVDDVRRLSPGVKLVVQMAAAFLIAGTSFRIEALSLPWVEIRLGAWSIPATILWIVAITNALNLLDGLDGLAAGVSFIASLTMFAICLLNQNVQVALLFLVLAGVTLGFLRYNFHPASIFLGDSGSYILGFILSILTLQNHLKGSAAVIMIIPILILGLPIMDTLLAMIRRLLNSLHIMGVSGETGRLKFFFLRGRAIFAADQDHIHHRLLKLGLGHKTAVFVLYGVTLILGGAALTFVFFQNTDQALLAAAVVLASYVGIRKLGYFSIGGPSVDNLKIPARSKEVANLPKPFPTSRTALFSPAPLTKSSCLRSKIS